MEYLLDTDICIAFLKNKFNVADKINSVGIENCYVSEITIIELTFGAYHSTNFDKHIKEVRNIQVLYDVLPIYSAVEEFSKEKSRLKAEGKSIPDFDLLIGTSAVANGMVMVTKNVKHLARIRDINIEDWSNKQFNEFLK